MPQSNQSQETTIALMAAKIDALQEEQDAQGKLIAGIKAERDKALLWGITALGAMVVAMGSWIVSFAKDHWK